MKIEQAIWNQTSGWQNQSSAELGDQAQLVLAFSSSALVQDNALIQEVCTRYPKAQVMGCSTSGEIYDTQVVDDCLTVTAVQFEHTEIKTYKSEIASDNDSYQAGKRLTDQIDKDGLVHLFVLSDGLQVNGSELVKGITESLPDVTVTGGLSGDGDRFEQTFVLWNNVAESGSVTALGLYGDKLRVGFGSMGGWDTFGPERMVTKSAGNVLYELDGKSALNLYKTYLGDHASGLPATALLFPLSIRNPVKDAAVVRTILAVNEEDQSMTFAGDIPEGSYARLMKANFDRIVDGAMGAAQITQDSLQQNPPELAILISCVGRKLILKQRIEEEVEAVRDIVGDDTVLTGFYSYGEISPFNPKATCELHNQTMTITAFSED